MRRTTLLAVVSGLVGALVALPVAVYASHSFNDVPNTNTFHAHIEWLKGSGVTKGCNPPTNTEFCPKDEVTREQMAAFMHRLAENRVVDAGTVDGMDASDLTVTASAEVDSTSGGLSADEVTTMNEVTIVAPANGSLVINGSADVDVSGGLAFGSGIEVYVDGREVGDMAAFSPDSMTHLSYSTAVEVRPGTYTVRQDVGQPGGLGDLSDADIFYNANNLTALFVPAGDVTVTAAGISNGSLMGD